MKNAFLLPEHAAPTILESGDRFQVQVVLGADGDAKLVLPRSLLRCSPTSFLIEDPTKQHIQVNGPLNGGGVPIGEPLARQLTGDHVDAVWLESISPGRCRIVITPTKSSNGSQVASGDAVASAGWEWDADDLTLLARPAVCSNPEEFRVGLRAARLATQPGFDELISLPMVRDMEVLEHQTRTAITVLRRMRGRAMLCDEVGLGKTVEAGLILSELLVRGLVRSILILTPPSLIAQWQGEMRRKFGIELSTHDDPAFRDAGPSAWLTHDRVIVSIHSAKREPHRSSILKRKWDLVIVDEAHHLRNRATEAWKFASEIEKQFILLLTATPVQNNLEELFNLVTLLEPGLLSTRKDFARRFMSRGDKLTPTNVDDLHALLAEVMVRNRRNSIGLQFTRRFARTESVVLGDAERTLHDAVGAMVRDGLGAQRQASDLNRMTLLTLQMALGSSMAAAASVLENLLDKPSLPLALQEQLQRLLSGARHIGGGAKVKRLLGLLDEFQDKLVVFTQFRATQSLLNDVLIDAGYDVCVFHGGLSRLGKEASIDRFRGPSRILLCTESGSEGRNLQFAHGLCNFDLPWNPMRIEQRIGRLSRIGQRHDIHVFNLVAANTIESAILHLLEAKLNMFELVIGEVDMILGNLDDEKEFESLIADQWVAASNSDEFAARMEVLGNRLLAAKVSYLRQRAQDEKIFGSRFAPEG